MAAVASWPLFFNLAMCSEALLRRALRVSASVMAWRRWVSTSRKSRRTAAGSRPRWRSFSSTKGKLSRTKFRSSMELDTVSETCRGMHACHSLWRNPVRCVNYHRDETLPHIQSQAASLRVSFSCIAGCQSFDFCFRLRLQRTSQTGRGDCDRSVSWRLSGALPRPVRRWRLPPFSRSRCIFHRLQLRLRKYAYGAGTLHTVYRGLYQRPRLGRERVVGFQEQARSSFC